MATGAHIFEQHLMRPRPPVAVRYWRSVTSFVRHKPLGAFGAFVVILLIAMAAFPALFTTQDPDVSQSLRDRLMGPSMDHWFGTDQQGRDLYTRIVYGARTSVIIGFGVVALSAVVALALGVTSGYFGGWFDILVQRLVDIGIALPGLIFIILLVTSLQQIPLLTRIIISVGVLVALGSSRVLRGAAISAKQNQYVEAARVLGARDIRIINRHVVPNVLPVLIISASIQIGGAVLVESSLAFLGYGVQPPTASWGRMLNEARDYMVRAPHMAIFPGLAIFFTVYGFNMFGDALRDVLDPRMRGSR